MELGEYHHPAHNYWREGVVRAHGTTAREHYEAQVVGADADRQATVLTIEVGFHSEYPKAAENNAVIAHLVANEKRWRRTVGKEAVVGEFLGRADRWRRVSETWPDPDLGDETLVIELGDASHRLHHRARTGLAQPPQIARGRPLGAAGSS